MPKLSAPRQRKRHTARLSRQGWAWAAAATLVMLLGATALVRWDIAARRDAFAVDARIAHRLLSQRAAQFDAVLATLMLVAQQHDAEAHAQRLPAVWPGIVAAHRSDADHPWHDTTLAAAEQQSRALPPGRRHAVLSNVDPARMQYTMVLAGTPASWALRVDVVRLVPPDEWPFSPAGPVRAWLAAGAQELLLHPGAAADAQPAGLTPGFTFAKLLASPSQPFELRLQRATGPVEWPWLGLMLWALLCAVAARAGWVALRARDMQRRQAELMRMAQVGRLNTLSELAAGVAHELNQPLAAVLASTQAARRLLLQAGPADNPAPATDSLDLPAVEQALTLAASQAQRASGVLTRLRRLVQNPLQSVELQAVDLRHLCLQMLDLLRPELQRRGIHTEVIGQAPAVWADPVMVEQIIHNLLSNAMQAFEAAGTSSPQISLELQALPEVLQVQFRVSDNGPGISSDQLDHVFEPFYSTRAGGLGLGLPLCQTLAEALGGTLQARQAGAADGGMRGAELRLTLPQASGQSFAAASGSSPVDA